MVRRGISLCTTHFNPRTPCGVRPPRFFIRADGADFNPRTPCGVRLYHTGIGRATERFQSTHPLRGATTRIPCSRADMPYFNPRTPCGVRRQGFRPAKSADRHFNPRTPCGVRLGNRVTANVGPWISIHAPLAGCDANSGHTRSRWTHFNPRTPCGVRLVFRLIRGKYY